MKSSEIKTIVVQLTADNVSEYNVDTTIFDDPYLEAATRAVEKIKGKKYGVVRAITSCWDKKEQDKPILYNSYFVLHNAGCHKKAELLRTQFKMQSDCDLSKEPIHGRVTNPKSKS